MSTHTSSRLETTGSDWSSTGPAGRTHLGIGTIHDVTRAERIRWTIIDVVALVALFTVMTMTFHLTFGPGWVWLASLGGAVLGVGIGTLAAWRRWPVWLTAAVTVAAYLFSGGLLAMPSTTIYGFLPTVRTLSGLLFGVVDAWKGVLTIDPPIGETGALLVVPLLTSLLLGVVAASIALRSGRPALAWIPPALGVLLGIGFGVQEPWQPVILAVLFTTITVVWTAYRRGHQQEAMLGGTGRLRWQPVALGAGVLAVAGLVTAAAAPVVAPQMHRQVLRDAIEPPLDVYQYPSPLQGFRANLKDHKEDVLFTVDGLGAGDRIRIATLDSYDGVSYNVTDDADASPGGGRFARIGARVPQDIDGDPVDVTVTIGDYTGVWLPTIGDLTEVSFTGTRAEELRDHFFYNKATGTGLSTAGLRSGDSYRLRGVVAPQPSSGRIMQADAGDINLPPVDETSEMLKQKADVWAGDAVSAGRLARTYEDKLRNGYYSNGLEGSHPSLSGHSIARMEELFAQGKQMIGDEEQYAVAMALMLRHQGVPARVGYGYVASGEGKVDVTGEDVSAWTEVYLADLGWVVFTPTPDQNRHPDQVQKPEPSEPRPQVENPPPPPERPDNPPPDNTPPEDSQQDDDDREEAVWYILLWVGLALIPLLIVGLPIALILGLKARRRKGRLLAPVAADRIAGGWAEVVDRARDLGVTPRLNDTRTEQADTLAEAFENAGDAGTSPQSLARWADASVFGPGIPSEEQIARYWEGVGAVQDGMGQSVSGWRRFRGRLSVASLRRWRP